MKSTNLVQLPYREGLGYFGNKASSLNWLLKKGFPIPASWIVPAGALRQLAGGELREQEAFLSSLEGLLDPARRYAVRSSATLEDGPNASYAGQFQSVLDVPGGKDLLEALKQVWMGAAGPGIETYQNSHHLLAHGMEMNALIQEMVQPRFSGVAFSINPLTGLDEIVVEAVEGSGEALVQDGRTPWRWVRKWGSYLEEPADAPLDPNLIDAVCQGTAAIASAAGKPIDLEWVYDGESLFWVQMRDVTARDIPVYSNHISREVFPGLIKPLIWSVNVPLVNGAWVRLLTEMIGPNEIQPEDLSKSFLNRAYFNMGTIGRIMELMGFPRESLELLMGLEIEGAEKPSFKPGPKTFRLLPRMAWFALSKLGFGRRANRHARSARRQYQETLTLDLTGLSEEGILAHIEEHFQIVQETAYFNIVTPLMAQLFNLLLDRRLEKLGLDPRETDLSIENQEFDPYRHLQDLYQLYQGLSMDDRQSLEQQGAAALEELQDAGAFRAGLAAFLARFGHLSDSGNDFSRVPWREKPELVLEMIRHHNWPERDGVRVGFSDLEISPFQRWRLAPTYRRAVRFQNLREGIGTAYTLGYGLFREAFLELGSRFQKRGLVDAVEDIMYLSRDEIEEIITTVREPTPQAQLVWERKAELERSGEILPPPMIIGDTPILPSEDESDLLKGTPTSRGSFTGPARIVMGLDDMGRVRPGDVLVVPYSDVSWTPLFAKAGAVVSEAGGILSHSSIIAREYGIPAVVAVPGACRLKEGTSLTVDGNNGQVWIGPGSVESQKS